MKGLPKINFDNDSTCEFFQRGKLTKSSFHSKNVVSTTRPLKLLHLNPFRPTRTASLCGNKYGLLIVDDFSRLTWVIFLVHKDEACEAFKIFSKRVQNEKGFCILSIRSDHSGEFENHVFENFCNENSTFCNVLPSTVLCLSHSTTLRSCYYYLSGPLLTATSAIFEASRTIWR